MSKLIRNRLCVVAPRRCGALVCIVAFSLLAASAHALPQFDPEDAAPGRGEQRGHPTAMVTEERGCWEVSTVRNASAAAVQAALPENWQPRRNAAGLALTQFVDYVCDEFSIDGLPARRTAVSWLVALAQNPATGERRSWTLTHGSDNPLYVQRLRKLGVDSRYLPRSTATIERIDATTSRVETRFVDDRPDPGHDYVRTATAPEPTGDLTTSPGGVFWFETTGGQALRLAYTNTIGPATTPTVTELFAAASVPATFGIENINGRLARGLQLFLRGSWTGDLTTHDL